MAEKLSKEDLAEKIMESLEVDLDSLVRMTREDLVRLYDAVAKLEANVSSELLNKPISTILNEEINGKPLRELTLGELVRKVRDEGPLGLGILPEIRGAVRREVKRVRDEIRQGLRERE